MCCRAGNATLLCVGAGAGGSPLLYGGTNQPIASPQAVLLALPSPALPQLPNTLALRGGTLPASLLVTVLQCWWGGQEAEAGGSLLVTKVLSMATVLYVIKHKVMMDGTQVVFSPREASSR